MSPQSYGLHDLCSLKGETAPRLWLDVADSLTRQRVRDHLRLSLP
jgi:hypothetical protein